MQARRNFTLELLLYSPAEIAEHQAGHPRCNFCRQHYYSSDELFTHMRARHFGSQVCQRAGGEFSYFENADSLIDHLRCADVQADVTMRSSIPVVCFCVACYRGMPCCLVIKHLP